MKRAIDIDAPTITPKKKRRTRIKPFVWTVLSMFGIFGGISSLFVGLVFIVIHTVVRGDRMFDQMGTGLLIAGTPLILIGSMFVDWINEKGD